MLNPFLCSESEYSTDTSSSEDSDKDDSDKDDINTHVATTECSAKIQQREEQVTPHLVETPPRPQNDKVPSTLVVPDDAIKIPSRNNSLTRRKSSETSSPLDDLDLIDIILKDGVHRELRSLTLKKENVQESPNLSPVKESSDDTSLPVLCNQILNFDVEVLDKLRSGSLGCFQGKGKTVVETIPIDGLTFGVHFLYADASNDKLITSSKPYALLDVIEDVLEVFNLSESQIIGQPTGIALTSFVLSENSPDFIIELVKSNLSENLDVHINFLTFFDVISENYSLECFEYKTNQPLMFNILNGDAP